MLPGSDTPISPLTAVQPALKVRDARLDFWRGLCLIDMVIVHLLVQGLEIGHYPHSIFGDYTRFAAGGFIFVAGLSVGRIFLPKAFDDAKRSATYLALLQRAFYILCVHYVATLGFMVFSPMRGEALPPIHQLVLDILLFREGYDLLPFYVVMMAMAPLMLEVIRRGAGWALAAVSIIVFLWGRNHHDIEAIPIQQTFFVVLWQLIFVAGLLFGAAFKRYDALATRTKAWVAASATVATAILSLLAYGWHFGLAKPDFLWFVKVPLSGGESLRYLAFIAMLITVTDLCWRRLADGPVDRFVSRLGRKSLAMYVSHVFVVGIIVAISYKLTVGPVLQWLYMPLAVGVVWCVAWIMETLAARQPRVVEGRTVGRLAPGSGMALTAGALLLVLGFWPQANHHGSDGAADNAFEEVIAWATDEEAGFLPTTIAPKFLSPVTPGILNPLGDEGDDAEVMAYAGAARTGRTQGNGVGGSPFRRQL